MATRRPGDSATAPAMRRFSTSASSWKPRVARSLLAHAAQPLARGEHGSGRFRADLADRDERPVEDDRIGERADREAVLVMPDAEAARIGVEGELRRLPYSSASP